MTTLDTKIYNAIMAQQSTLDQLSQFRSLISKSPRACVVPFVPRVAVRIGEERRDATWREILWRAQGLPTIAHGYGVPLCGNPRCIAPHHQRVRYSDLKIAAPTQRAAPSTLVAPRREFQPTLIARLKRALFRSRK